MYVKAKNSTVERFPFSVFELRKENPNVSLPRDLTQEQLASMDVFPVVEQPQPDTDRFSYSVKRQLPELVDGQWTILWDIIAKSAEQLAEDDARQTENVRESRNGKLAATDWRYRRDQTTTPEWDAYCQALRDVPAQAGFPWTVEWPVAP